MKRFLMYVVVLIGLLFVGFTTYYFVVNKENIYLNFEKDSTIYYNVGESFKLDDVLTHTKPYNDTTKQIECADSSVLQYNEETNTFTALKAGSCNVVITTNNKDFARFPFTVIVCDGSTSEFAYVIKTADDLKKIGTETDGWSLNKCYRLNNNIDLDTPTTKNWTPIGYYPVTDTVDFFTGEFYGNDHTISNLKIKSTTNMPAGLFAVLGDNAVVEGVFFKDCSLDGNFDMAGLVTALNYGKIGMIDVQNLTINNTNTKSYTGGIAGTSYIFNLNGKLSARPSLYMCQVSIDNLTATGNVGGIVGSNSGGIISDSNATVKNGTCTGAVGGIVGVNTSHINEDGSNYRFSIIKNVYSVFNLNKLSLDTTSAFGNIIGKAGDIENTFDLSNTYSNLYYKANSHNAVGYASFIPDANNLDDYQTVELNIATALSDAELKQQTSYTNFDFENIWGIEEGSYAMLTFELATYNHIIPFDVGVPITSKEGAIASFETMRNFPTVATTYTFALTEDIVITPADFAGNNIWIPIGAEVDAEAKTIAFAGNIVFTSPYSLTLKGFTIAEGYSDSGIFGKVTGNILGNAKLENGEAVVKDNENNYFILEDITLNSAGNSAGTLAGTSIGKISNITVVDAKLTSSAKTIGGVIGNAEGEARNLVVKISENESAQNFVKATSASVVGGVVGLMNANSSNLRALVIDIEIDSESTTGNVVVGGVIGQNGTSKSSPTASALCFDEASEIIETKSNNIIAGGLVAENYGRVTASSVVGNINLISTELPNKQSITGGLVGKNLGASSSLTTSYYDGSRGKGLKGMLIGGLVGQNQGTIAECFTHLGEIKGKYVGGLVGYNYSTVTNCYTTSSLLGTENGSIVSGLAHELLIDKNLKLNGEQVESKITFCFVRATLSSNGEKYAETYSPFRLFDFRKWIISWTNGKVFGTVENCIILNEANNKVQSRYSFGGSTAGWIDVKDEDIKGENAKGTFTKYMFSETIWDFDSTTTEGEDGSIILSYPTLKNVKLPTE